MAESLARAAAARRRKARRLPLALLLALAAVAPAGAADGGRTGSIDLEIANRLVGDYFRHVVKRLPGEWRKAEERKLRDEPPRIEPPAIFQINAPAGRIAFEYDAENRRLLCYAAIHKLRDEYPMIGLSREEILTALQRAAGAGVGTGGGELIFEPVAKGFFLRRTYSDPPKSPRQMAAQLDRLMAAGEKWSREHYLQAVLDHARTLRPPPTATGRDGAFQATIVLTPDPRYQDQWRRPPGAIQPQLVSRSDFRLGQEVWALALFSGETAAEEGQLRLEAQYSFIYPDGSQHGSQVGKLWWSAPPPADHLQMSEFRSAIELGPDMPTGDYLARIKVCNPVSQRCVTAESPFRVLPP